MLDAVKQAVLSIYPYLALMLPPLRFIPMDVFFGVIDAVDAGMENNLKAQVNIRDWRGLMRMFKEIGDNAVISNEKERREAIYAVLVFVTDIEDHLTLEDFMAMDL